MFIRRPLVLYRQHGNNTCGFGSGTDTRHRAGQCRIHATLALSAPEQVCTRAGTDAQGADRHQYSFRTQTHQRRGQRGQMGTLRRLLLLRAEINADNASFLTRQKLSCTPCCSSVIRENIWDTKPC